MKGTHAGEPTHLMHKPWDEKSLCGIKDPLPIVLVRAAQAHIDGYGMEVCRDCELLLAREETK